MPALSLGARGERQTLAKVSWGVYEIKVKPKASAVFDKLMALQSASGSILRDRG